MSRVVDFYSKLPRGPAPEVKAKGLFARYQARYFGKNASAMRKLLDSPHSGQLSELVNIGLLMNSR